MKEYLFVFRGGGVPEGPNRQELIARDTENWKNWMGTLAQSGKFVGGNPLAAGGKTLRGKAVKITDAPFAEAKEVLNGYIIVNSHDYNEAVEMAKGCPIFEFDGSVEVRELAKMDM